MLLLSISVVFLVVIWTGLAAAEKRIALVIGNGSYAQTRPLANPVRDAKAMSEKLISLGFDVIYEIDRTKVELERIFQRFVSRSKSAETALVFYAGHGIQVRGKNYVIPIDAKLKDVSDVEFELLEVDKLVASIEKQAKRTLVFLDACRDNPFIASMKGYTRSVGDKGLAQTKASLGTLVAFAAQPGAVASDGVGRHSPFTSALLKYLGRPGESISQTLIRVRRSVYKETKGEQIPQDFNSLLDDAFLVAAASNQLSSEDLRKKIAAAKAKLARLQGAESGRGIDPKPAPKKKKWKPGQRFRDCENCPEMVVVPAGQFVMGSPADEDLRLPNEGPQKEIEIPKAFAMGRYEVSVGEFKRYVKASGNDPSNDLNSYCWEWVDKLKRGRDNNKHSWRKPGFRQRNNFPVVCVSWVVAGRYVKWLSKITGKTYRLPSEAEWEYAARAGSSKMFSSGSRISVKVANFSSWHDQRFAGARKERFWHGKPVKVSKYRANKFGLYQMHGNVWEMVQDCFHSNLRLVPPDGQPYVRDGCQKRIRKGGSWLSLPWDLRSARRFAVGFAWREQNMGFRILRELD
ncbi:MAG: SUMF1/EgtB/PvdO family nonheme iron enzyme [Alphaproteobacteria bacterium]|nr:SUMF1/EgtB/PvdO family nonheme iron enzyme [Alphaproteobacteria bacterium]